MTTRCATCPNPLPPSDIPGCDRQLCDACTARCPAELVAANRDAALAASACQQPEERARLMAEVARTARACLEAVR